MSKRQHIPMSEREPVVTLERSALSRGLRGDNVELVLAGRKIRAKDCEHMLRELSDDSHADFKALSALSIEDLATLRYFVVAVEGGKDGSLREQQRYRRHRDKSACYFYGLYVDFLALYPAADPDIVFGEPPA
jgi:hypothetical protein